VKCRPRGRITVVVLAVLAAGCGGDDAPSITGTAAPTTTSTSTTTTTTTTTTIAPERIQVLDDGRLRFVLPEGYRLLIPLDTTGIFGEQISGGRYSGPPQPGSAVGSSLSVSVFRGPSVADGLERPPMTPSTVDGGPGRAVYEGHIDLPLPSNQLAWRVSDEVVVWLASPDLTVEALAMVLRDLELTA
jgi:hypothetical protein